MKIKSLLPTNSYKHIAFGDIKDSWGQAAVLAPSGFSKVLNFSRIKSLADTIKLSLSNGETLVCDPHHRVRTSDGRTVFVVDLNPISDRLDGYGGLPIAFTKESGPLADLYDIEIADPHWYYTSGVVSHNSIALINTAVANVLNKRNVLYVTLELSDSMSALRALGVITKKPISKRRLDFKDEMMGIVNHLKNSGEVGTLAFHEFPPDEISVDDIHALVDHLRRSKGWSPDVIIIDYLELMVSRRASDNREDYVKQKSVSTQVRGLAQKENVVLFSATQTNRSGNDSSEMIDVTKIAESYGKSMAMDYLVSINQSKEEYDQQFDPVTHTTVHPAPARMYIAKNRTGSRFITIQIRINYNTMAIEEVQ